MALTAKQRRFVDEYLIDLNATQAAIRAGYSKKTAEVQASRLLSNVKVQTVMQQLMLKRELRTEITQDKVLADIEKVKQHAMKTGHDAQGNEVMNNYPAALKASELQGKHLGMWVEKQSIEVTGKNGGALQSVLTTMTQEEYRAIAKEVANKI